MPDFETDGYSQESVDMLKAPEGQGNAVFACFGSAAQHAQLFEQSLRDFLAVYRRFREERRPGEEKPKGKGHAKQTMGQLLREFLAGVSVNYEGVVKVIEAALPLRNHLIHRYFLDRGELFRTEKGRRSMLSELATTEEVLRQATAVVGGLRVAFIDAVEGRSEEASDVLFSADIDLAD